MNKFSSNFLANSVRAAFLTVAMCWIAGCGQRSVSVTADEGKAFDSAPAEVKQTWEKVLAADKANDYLATQTALDSLDKMILSDPQRKALEDESSAFAVRLMHAVDKNDPAALKAVQQINQARDRRR